MGKNNEKTQSNSILSSNIKQEVYNPQDQRSGLKETFESSRGRGNYRGGYRGGFNPRRGGYKEGRPYVPREYKDSNSGFTGNRRPYIPREQREYRDKDRNSEFQENQDRGFQENFSNRRPFHRGRGGRQPLGPRRDHDDENPNENYYHNHKTDYTKFKDRERKENKYEFNNNNNNYSNSSYNKHQSTTPFGNNSDINVRDAPDSHHMSYKAKNDGYNIPISNIDKVESKQRQQNYGYQDNDTRKSSTNIADEDLQKPIFKGKISDYDRQDYQNHQEKPVLVDQGDKKVEIKVVGGDVSFNIKYNL